MTLIAITGTSRGIGRATALELGRRGVTVALLGRRSPDQDLTERLLSEAAARWVSLSCELSDVGQVRGAAEELLRQHGCPDAVIHNAGVAERALVVETSDRSYEAQMAVNLRAPIVLSQALLPAMLSQGHGRIIHVASISSTLGTKGAAVYCASKWALLGFMKSLAEELSDTGLMTMALLPGSVDTRMLEGSGFAPRLSPEEVARTLAYYALDAPLSHNGASVEMFGV